MDQIIPNLYLGGIPALKRMAYLRQHNVKFILSVAKELERWGTDYGNDIQCKLLLVEDDPKEYLISRFDECFEFIEEGLKNGAVLVHCMAGVSRSASVVIAYLMKSRSKSFEECYREVKSRRPMIFPNEGFVEQLQLYEKLGCTLSPTPTNKSFYNLYKLQLLAYQRNFRKAQEMFYHYTQHSNVQTYRCKNCSKSCGAHYIEILPWMLKATDNEGKLQLTSSMPAVGTTTGILICHECDIQVGDYNWKHSKCEHCNTTSWPSFRVFKDSVQLVEN